MLEIALACGGSLLAGIALAAWWGRRTRQSMQSELDISRRDSQQRAAQISQVSHEMRTPLAAIKAAAAILADERTGPVADEQRRFLDVMVRQSDLAISIAEDLLLQSRLEVGAFRMQPSWVDMGTLVRHTAMAFRPLAEEREQRLLYSLPQLSPRAWIDERLISQALTNMLSNAIKHSSANETITVVLSGDPDQVVLSVTDGGAGMTPEERQRLFLPFVTSELGGESPELNTKHFGASVGLGMALTRQIAELHGGRVLVDTAQRRGTTVMIALPRDRREASAHAHRGRIARVRRVFARASA